MRYNRALVITDIGHDFDGKVLYTNNILSSINKICEELSVISYNDSFFEKEKIYESIVYEGKTKGLFLKYFFSLNPMMVCRSFHKGIAAYLREKSNEFDLIVINHHSMLWTAKYLNPKAKILFVTHNVETEVALSRLKVSRNPVNILFGLIDYIKHWVYERRNLDNSMIISAISNHDKSFFQKKYKNNVIKILPFIDVQRTKSSLKKKEIVIIGSFYWKIKQQNLLNFLREANSYLLQHEDIVLKVIGGMNNEFKEVLDTNFKVEIHDNIDDFSKLVQHSRIGLIVDKAGGGFKLKILDYISYGLPIYSIKEGVTTDLNGDGIAYLTFDTYKELIKQVLEDIDKKEKLEKMRTILIEDNSQLLTQPLLSF